MDTLQRLHQLLDERGWSEYRLAKNCGLSNSTIANIYHRNTIPSISTLEAICTSFGISLSQFFAEGEMVELTPELKELFDNWVNLTPQQKDAVLQTMRAMPSSLPQRDAPWKSSPCVRGSAWKKFAGKSAVLSSNKKAKENANIPRYGKITYNHSSE